MILRVLPLIFLTGCVSIPLSTKYAGPQSRPPELAKYYKPTSSFSGYRQKPVMQTSAYIKKEIEISSLYGTIQIDYFDHLSDSDDLVLVFPLLGGKPIVSNHFAQYFAENGIDAAIIRRNDDFKNPKNFKKIEEILRENVIRDRIAMDFFEKIYHKKDFGGFGVSRGAINLAMTAGVDPRLKYPVIAMGASDLPLIFKHSDQRRIKKYVDQVMKDQSLTKEQLYKFLDDTIRTDPKQVAKFIDARNALLFLCVFDQTVPYEYGRRLRKSIGNPRTIFLLANHYTVVLYTQLFSVLPPGRDKGLFPFDYIELESLEFFRKSFGIEKTTWSLWPFKILRIPFDLVGLALEKWF